jgi:hypothetical protein
MTARDIELDGWAPRPVDVPAWWDPTQAAVAVPFARDAAADAVPEEPASASVSAEPQLSLLAPEPPSAAPTVDSGVAAAGQPDWVQRLLTSPRLADQRRLAGRARLDDADLGTLLTVLVAAGGTASGATLQRTLELSPTRLRGKLEAARSLLDVDGYAVLRVEVDGTATLNTRLLAEQFDIDVPYAG